MTPRFWGGQLAERVDHLPRVDVAMIDHLDNLLRHLLLPGVPGSPGHDRTASGAFTRCPRPPPPGGRRRPRSPLPLSRTTNTARSAAPVPEPRPPRSAACPGHEGEYGRMRP